MVGRIDRDDIGGTKWSAWSRASASLVLAASLFATAGGAWAQAGGGTSSGKKDCFTEYLEHLQACKRKFGGGIVLTASERMLLAACIDGAKAVLDDCLHPSQP